MKRRFYAPLLTYPDAPNEAFLDSLVDLAVNCNAFLHAGVVHVSIPPVSNPWPMLVDMAEMVRQAEDQSRQQGKALSTALRNRCSETSLDYAIDFYDLIQSEVDDAVVREARLYDLAVLQSGLQFATFAEAVVFESGRPVMLYPEHRCPGRFDHIVVAWDESRAASRAVADAAFLINKAQKVTVLCAPDDKPRLPAAAERFAESIASSGAKVEVATATGEERIGDLIQLKALEVGGDLLVMGGYGHSRLREFVLGGATSDVLSKTRLPVLMSH